MEARSLRCELDEHRDRAVRLRARFGEEPVRDLALHHHRPPARRSAARRRLSTTIGVATLYGRFATSLPGAGLERREVETEGVAEVELDVVPASEPFREVRLESAVELDRVHQTNALRQVVGQHSETWTDLEHDVLAVERGEPVDHAEDVLVDQEMLAEVAVRCDRELHGSEKATLGVRCDPGAELVRILAAGLGQLGDGQHDVRRLVRAAAPDLRGEIGAVGLRQDPLGRNLGGRRAQIARLGVRDVACEGDVVAALEHGVEETRARRSSA